MKKIGDDHAIGRVVYIHDIGSDQKRLSLETGFCAQVKVFNLSLGKNSGIAFELDKTATQLCVAYCNV